MFNKSVVLGVFIVSSVAILFTFGQKVFCDDAGDPYSSEGTGNIGAWYDETWQASGFYRLQSVGTSDEFRYQYTTTPTTSSKPTFVKDGYGQLRTTAGAGGHANSYTDINEVGISIDKTTTTGGGHAHSYTDATSGASLPQDLVITEWRVTGHVHFAHQ
jgi:hypothetical protein